VLDVLLLLAVSRRLFEGLDDEGRGGWNNGDSGLTVLDSEPDRDTETFLLTSKQHIKQNNLRHTYPITSGLRDIFSDLLRGKTKRTDLGRKS